MTDRAAAGPSRSGGPREAGADRRARLLLALAAVAVAFAAADTYVVVLALPDMMTTAGVPLDELQRAAPIISGFLLGYVAVLPLIGRIADLEGRVPVLVASLVVFAVGSLVTVLSYDLPSMVAGRFLQGVGGGGLVPATLALVADLYPAGRRAVPLGVVSAVQELGSVLGPLLGALVLVVAPWQAIFALNLLVGAVLALAVARLAPDRPGPEPGATRRRVPDPLGLVLLVLAVLAAGLTATMPPALLRDLTWGRMFIPVAGDGRWLTPAGLVAVATALALVVRCTVARHPLIDVRRWGRSVRAADLPGSLLVALALGGVVLAFATADPQVAVLSAQGPWFLLGSAVAVVLLVVHLRRAAAPLVPRGALSPRPVWGSLVVSLLVGAALIAALVDVPLFARTTVYPDSQLLAALVLVRFLVALPVGAVLGGVLLRRLPAGVVAAVGMAAAALAFALMSRWDIDALESWTATVPLVLGGLGFGLALAPINAAALAASRSTEHGVVSAFVVVARMVGMLVGASALTTLGLRAYYAEQRDLPTVREVCGGRSRCEEFTLLLRQAGIAQEQVVFAGAAVCAGLAALLALVLLRGVATRDVLAAEALRSA